jgi:hypothetical protein
LAKQALVCEYTALINLVEGSYWIAVTKVILKDARRASGKQLKLNRNFPENPRLIAL